MKKRLLSLLLAVCMAFSLLPYGAYAEDDEPVETIEYDHSWEKTINHIRYSVHETWLHDYHTKEPIRIKGGEVYVEGCDEDDFVGNLSIAATVDGYPVVRVSELSNLPSLKSVTIPENVKEIDLNAFEHCEGLVSVSLPSTLKRIGRNAFEGCISLSTLTLPSGLIEIGYNAFSGCISLKTLNIPGNVKTIADGAFADCTSLRALTLNEGIVRIGDWAFCNNRIKNVVIPNSVVELGGGAFAGCNYLEWAVIGDGVVTLRGSAFDAKNLKALYLGTGLMTIEYGVCPDSKEMSDVYYAGTKAQWEEINGHDMEEFLYADVHYEWDGSIAPSASPTPSGADGIPTLHAMVVNGISGEGSFGCDNDAALVLDRLRSNALPGYVTNNSNIHSFRYNVSSSPIDVPTMKSWISSSFADTDGDDLSVFYFTGNGGELDGLSLGHNTSFIWSRLASILANKIRGKIVVILDSCHSGEEIMEGIEKLSVDDRRRISVLSSCSSTEAIGVHTALRYQGLYYGKFTYVLGQGIGFFDGVLHADADDDSIVTVGELYDYTEEQVREHFTDLHIQEVTFNRNQPVFAYLKGESITFDESFTCNVNESIAITATYKGSIAPAAKDCAWTCSDSDAVTFSGTTIQGPSTTGEANTYQISTMVTPNKGGEYQITLSVGEADASATLTVGGDGVHTLHAMVLNGAKGDESVGTDNGAAMMYTRLCENQLTEYVVKSENIHPFSYNKDNDPTTADVINTYITHSFSDSDEDDLSIFYYNGHGNTGAGIVLANNRNYPWQGFLPFLLEKVKGRIVIILDACHSESAIDELLTEFDELAEDQDRISIIASCASDEQSKIKTYHNLTFPIFSYYVGLGIGYIDGKLHADTNKDSVITLGELYNYTSMHVYEDYKYMHVQLFAHHQDLPLFEYHGSSLTITEQPKDYTGALNSMATFTVQAAGDGLTYQWQLSTNGGKTWSKSSVTSSVYTAKLTAAKDGRMVRCIVEDAEGHTVISDAATMRIGPTIKTQPADYVGAVYSTASFFVEAEGNGLTYQWQLSTNGGRTWSKSSVKTAVYSATLTAAKDGRLVRCIVTDSNGVPAISEPASMRIGPVITRQPVDYYGPKNSSATVTIDATGKELKYQWQVSDDGGKTWGISRIKTKLYQVDLVPEKSGRLVRCIVTDVNGVSVTSQTAVMKIVNITITQQPKYYIGPKNSTAKFTVQAEGEGLTYQWMVSDDNGLIWSTSSIKKNTYSVRLTEERSGRILKCIITDANGDSLTTNTVGMRIG